MAKLDAFAVAVGLEYYGSNEEYLTAGDEVVITSSNMVMKDGKQFGSIAKQEKYYDIALDSLQTLVDYETIELQGDDFVVLNGDDINELIRDNIFEDAIGTITYTDNKIALVYLGTADEDFFFPEEEFDEDVCYALTEKGEALAKALSATGEAFTSLEDDLLNTICELAEERKEEKTMDNVFGKFGFGKLNDNRFALSINGIAVRQHNTNKFVVYNKENNEFVDTTDMLINIKDALFVLPSVDIAAGDTIIHEDKPYYIVSVGNEIKAVSYDDCTQTVLIPKTTMFGIKYFTKVFSLFGDNFAATGELFSNPMMLMTLINGEGNTDISKLLLLSSLSKGDLASNPMAMAMLMKDGNSDFSTLAMMSMLNGSNPFAKTTKKTTTTKE